MGSVRGCADYIDRILAEHNRATKGARDLLTVTANIDAGAKSIQALANVAPTALNIRGYEPLFANLPTLNLYRDVLRVDQFTRGLTTSLVLQDAVFPSLLRGSIADDVVRITNALTSITDRVAPQISAISAIANSISLPRAELTAVAKLQPVFSSGIAEIIRTADWRERIDLAGILKTAEQVDGDSAEEVTAEDVGEAKAILVAPDFQGLSTEGKIDYLYQAIKRQERPAIKIILLFIVLQFLATPIQDAYHALRDLVAEKVSPAAILKGVQKFCTNDIHGSSSFRGLRLITRPEVSVRASYRRHAPELAVLTIGRCVGLLRKRKKWALVEWADDKTGLVLQGWVRNKYLARLVR